MDPAASPDAPDPRIARVRRLVVALAMVVGVIFAASAVLAVYHLATERPARELFFPPDERLQE